MGVVLAEVPQAAEAQAEDGDNSAIQQFCEHLTKGLFYYTFNL